MCRGSISRSWPSLLFVAVLFSGLVSCGSAPTENEDFLGFFSEASDREPAARDTEIVSTQGHVQISWILTQESKLSASSGNCQIEGTVRAAWPSKHPGDVYLIYYEKNGSLYGLRPRTAIDARPDTANCRGFISVALFENLKKSGRKWHFAAVEDPHSDFVAMALSQTGTFIAWDSSRAAFKREGIDAFRLNPCYRTKRRAFNQAVAFLHSDSKGLVTELIGKRSSGGQIETQTHADHYYATIVNFVQDRRVCAYNGS